MLVLQMNHTNNLWQIRSVTHVGYPNDCNILEMIIEYYISPLGAATQTCWLEGNMSCRLKGVGHLKWHYMLGTTLGSTKSIVTSNCQHIVFPFYVFGKFAGVFRYNIINYLI